MQHKHCLSSRNRCKATKWSEDKASYTFEQSDRSWIRHEGNPGVELMLLNFDSSNAKTSVLIVDKGKNNSEMIEKLDEVSRDTRCGQILEGQPLSLPSRTTIIKLSRICPKHPRNETKMTSVRELRETRGKSLQDRARESQCDALNSTGDHWRPSKSPTMGDEHRTAMEVYDRGKMKFDGGDTGQVMRKAMLTPEGKWFTYSRAHATTRRGLFQDVSVTVDIARLVRNKNEMWLCQAMIVAAGSLTGITKGGKRRNKQRKVR